MSLQVWLPLVSDYKNQGLSNLTFTPENTSYTSIAVGGKIGSNCYHNSSNTAGGLMSDTKLYLGTKVSMCCWVKFTSLMSSSSLGGSMGGQHRYQTSTGMGLTLKYISSTTGYLSCNTGQGGGESNRTYNTYCNNTLLSAGTWYHVCFTYDGSTIRFYLNGKADGSHSYTGQVSVSDYIHVGTWSANDASYGRSVHPNYKLLGYMNDFRIYDHVLSPKEVKEIAKGLRLHYQLNSPRMTNLNPWNWGIYNNNSVPATCVATGEYFLGQPVYRLTMTPNSDTSLSSFKANLWAQGLAGNSATYNASTSYCYWIYYRPISHSDVRVGGTASNCGGWTEISPHYFGDGWYRVGKYRNGSDTTTRTDPSYTSFYTPSAQLNVPVVIDFCAPCLVSGITKIPENYGVYESSTTETDVSGYGYHATIYNHVVGVCNSPRYKNSYYFGSTAYIKPPAMNFTGMANSYTITYWSKIADMSGKMAWGFNDGGSTPNYLTLYPSSHFNWNTGDVAANPFMLNGSNVGFTAYNGAWHHYAITGNGSTTTLYIDGEVKGYAKTYKSIAATQFYISGWDSGTGYKWSGGNISDFRVYATCLSAEDVAELAKSAASTSKNGVTFAYDFSEFTPMTNATNATSVSSDVTKSGIMYAGGLQDRSMPTYEMKTKALEDGSVWARIHWLDVSTNKTYISATETAKCINQPNRYSRMGDVEKFKSQQSLPAGYTELEYIQSTGTQYIDTGFIPNQNTRVDARFSAASYANNQLFVYGGGQDSNALAFELYPWTSGTSQALQFNYGNNAQFIGAPVVNKIITTYQQKNTSQCVINNTVSTVNHTAQSFTAPYTLTLFALHRASIIKSTSTAAMKLYSCQIYDNGKLVRNFVPCKNSSGTVGLYDRVEKKFYSNAGTGSFTAGAFVSKYEFMLTYPRLSSPSISYNRWEQTSSPNNSSVTGYAPIWLSWPSTSAGIRKHGTSCVYNCDTGDTWYAPIGQYSAWSSGGTAGIPAANRSSTPQLETELWVRVDKASEATKLQIFQNSISATDFIEI